MKKNQLFIHSIFVLLIPRLSFGLPDFAPEIARIYINTDQRISHQMITGGCATEIANGRTLAGFDLQVWNIGDEAVTYEAEGEIEAGYQQYQVRDADTNEVLLQNTNNFTYYSSRRCDGQHGGSCDEEIEPPYELSPLFPGWAIEFEQDRCAFADVTDLPPGNYKLTAEYNRNQSVLEQNFGNNSAETEFKICRKPKKARVQAIFGPINSDDGEVPVRLRLLGTLAKGTRFNPVQDGLSLNAVITSDVGSYRNTDFGTFNLPAGSPGTGCDPEDGWEKIGRLNWKFRSDSGRWPGHCKSDAWNNFTKGIREATFTRRGRKVSIELRGKLLLVDNSIPIPLEKILSTELAADSLAIGNDTCESLENEAKLCIVSGLGRNVVVCK